MPCYFSLTKKLCCYAIFFCVALEQVALLLIELFLGDLAGNAVEIQFLIALRPILSLAGLRRCCGTGLAWGTSFKASLRRCYHLGGCAGFVSSRTSRRIDCARQVHLRIRVGHNSSRVAPLKPSPRRARPGTRIAFYLLPVRHCFVRRR